MNVAKKIMEIFIPEKLNKWIKHLYQDSYCIYNEYVKWQKIYPQSVSRISTNASSWLFLSHFWPLFKQ